MVKFPQRRDKDGLMSHRGPLVLLSSCLYKWTPGVFTTQHLLLLHTIVILLAQIYVIIVKNKTKILFNDLHDS